MPISALPPAPSPADTPAEFNTKAFNTVAALAAFVTEANALEVVVNAAELSAIASATTATTKAQVATDQAAAALSSKNAAGTSATESSNSAVAAEVSRIAASKLNLGNKASPPSLDNQGVALLQGSTYFDSTLNKWRVWNGSSWIEGISSVAGVSSLNGNTGSVDITSMLHALALSF